MLEGENEKVNVQLLPAVNEVPDELPQLLIIGKLPGLLPVKAYDRLRVAPPLLVRVTV